MRVYIPAFFSQLKQDSIQAIVLGEVDGQTYLGVCLNQGFCQAFELSDYASLRGEMLEEAEDQALHYAALLSLEAQLDAQIPIPDLRRVVLSADLDETTLFYSSDEPPLVASTNEVNWSQIVCIHIDEAGCGEEIFRWSQTVLENKDEETCLELPALNWYEVSELGSL